MIYTICLITPFDLLFIASSGFDHSTLLSLPCLGACRIVSNIADFIISRLNVLTSWSRYFGRTAPAVTLLSVPDSKQGIEVTAVSIPPPPNKK